MTFISFIFNFPWDLNNAPAKRGHKHKVPREVKNKGYYHHPIIVIYSLVIVPLELGKQHHTGEKKNDPTDQQSFSPSTYTKYNKHKVPREVKNKGNYHHPINNYYCLVL